MARSITRRTISKRRHDLMHANEAWCLVQAVSLGTWLEAGLNREVIDGRVAGYWKKLRCGHVFVLEVFDSEDAL